MSLDLYTGPDLDEDDPDALLEELVRIALFTDRRAADDERAPDGSEDRRGWWADAYSDRPIGTRLWLLSRSELSDETVRRARDYAEEALDALVTDRWITGYELTLQRGTVGRLDATVVLRRERLADLTLRLRGLLTAASQSHLLGA